MKNHFFAYYRRIIALGLALIVPLPAISTATLIAILCVSSSAEASNAKRLLNRARSGDTTAMRQLARGLWDGTIGQSRDCRTAVMWWKKAADAGDTRSMVILGDMYANGVYFSKNIKKAREYYEAALEAGYGKAQKRLDRFSKEKSIASTQKQHTKENKELAASNSEEEPENVSYSNELTTKNEEANAPQHLTYAVTKHTRTIKSLAFSPCGNMLVTADERNIIFWDVQKKTQIGKAIEHGMPRSVSFSPDGKLIVSGSFSNKDNSIRIWNVETRRQVGKTMYVADESAVGCVSFSPDGKLIVSGSTRGVLQLWDAKTQEPVGSMRSESGSGICSVSFSPDGRVLASSAFNETCARLWDIKTQREIGTPMQHEMRVNSVCFNPDGTQLASSSCYGVTRLWDVNTQQELASFKHETAAVCFSPDGHFLVSSANRSLCLWDVKAKRLVGKAEKELIATPCCSFSPDGRSLAVGACDLCFVEGFSFNTSYSRLQNTASLKPSNTPSKNESLSSKKSLELVVEDFLNRTLIEEATKIRTDYEWWQLVAHLSALEGKESLNDLKAKSRMGDVTSQMNLAGAYLYGTMGVKDPKKAFELYSTLWNKGSLMGAIGLSACYHMGAGVNKDLEAAATYYEKLCERKIKHPFVFWGLASCYRLGEGKPNDFQQAANLLHKAHELKPGGMWSLELGILYFLGLGVDKDIQRAIALIQTCDLINSQFILGCCFLTGQGVKQDKKLGVQLLTQAAGDEANSDTHEPLCRKQARLLLQSLAKQNLLP